MFKKMLLFFLISASLLFYGLVGFYIVPPLVKKQLAQSIEKVLRVKAEIESVSFNPFTFKIGVHHLRLSMNKSGEMLGSIEDFEADIEPSYLFFQEIRIKSVLIKEPLLYIYRDKAGELNLFNLLRSEQEESGHDQQKMQLPQISIGELLISAGRVEISDEAGSARVSQSLTPISVRMHDFSTMRKSGNELSLDIGTGDGGHLGYKAQIDSLEPLQIDGEIELRGLMLQTYWRYFQDRLGLSAEGAIDASVSHTLSSSENGMQFDINKYKVDLKGLLVQEKKTKETLAHLLHLNLEGSADITNKEVDLTAIEVKGLFVKVKQNSTGEINWLSYFPMHESEPDAEASTLAWSVKKLKIRDAGGVFEDNFSATEGRVQLDNIALDLQDMSSKGQHSAKGSLSFLLNTTGAIAVNSEFTLAPFKTTTAIRLEGLELSSLQAYLSRHAEMQIKSGLLDMNVTAEIREQKTHFTGNSEITALALSRPDAKPFLSFGRVLAEGIDLVLEPNRVSIAALELASPAFHLNIGEDNRSNLSGILRSEQGSPEAEEAFEFLIGMIRLNEGEIGFEDRSLEIPYAVKIDAISGTLLSVGNQAEAKSRLDLEGVIDKYAPAKLSGTLLFADPKAFTRMEAGLKNINMSNLSSYSGKYIGYRLKEGKMDADLSYVINNSQLESSNKIVLKGLELGKKLESSESASPSIELAIALLKDSSGVIDLDIPIAGNLDAPGFALAPLVWQAFRNLSISITTAPFRFLGKIVGIDADKLENIYFEAGQSALLPPQQEVLDKLSTLLLSKKSLLLEISGSYDEIRDAPKTQEELEQLARERGESIFEHLLANGVQRAQLRLLPGSKAKKKAPQNAYVPSRLSLKMKQ